MKRILFLDDNPDILFIVKELLSYENYNVAMVPSAENIIPIAERFQPDLIMLDYLLTDGNGGDICRAFKAHPDLSDIPVIMLTAYQKRGLNFMDYGCDAVVEKPFDLDELLQTIDGLLTA